MPGGVLDKRVERQAEPFPVGAYGDGVEPPGRQALADGGAPAADMVGDQLVKLNVLGMQERRVTGRGDDEKPLGDSPQSAQLADDDPDVLALLLAAEVGGEEFRVAEGDGDRGTQL